MDNTEVNLVTHAKLPISLPNSLDRIVCITMVLKILKPTYRMVKGKF